jgi:N-acetylglutamate synthase-like GNAT family acetyltransferase
MTATSLVMSDASAAELSEIAASLAEASLPIADLGLPGRRFYCARGRNGRLIGFSGLEIYGTDALLRSVLVMPPERRRGFGSSIIALTLDRAAALGAGRVFLLTAGAPSFFAHLGFTTIARDQAPAAIAATAEFERLCPATATCMMKMVGLPP